MYSSSVLCYRSKGPISFSFSDHSYFLSSRFDKYPFAPSSCCCTCSCCCASSTCCGGHSGYQVHISPYLSLGLRKSALLQWAASRRVVLVGADQYYCRFPLYGIYRDVYEGNSCDFVESSRDGRNGGRRKKIRCLGSEKSDEIKRRMSRFEDAEAVLSLLSEEVDRKCFDLRERKRSSSKRYGAEKEKTCVNDNYRVKKKNVGLVSSESNSKCKLESVEIKCRNEVHGQKEGREMFRREGNLRTKKGGSSCSSYHSLLSSGDFESDLEDTKAEGFVEESSAGFYNDTLRDESKINTKMLEAHNQLNEAREGNESMERRNSVSRSNMEWDWRKKSEKKLTDLSYTEAQLKKESFEGYSTMSRTDEYDNRRSFNSQGQFIDKEKISADLESKELVHLCRNNTEALSISELEKKSEKTKVCMACGSDVRTSVETENQLICQGGKLTVTSGSVFKNVNEHRKAVDDVAERDEFTGNTQEISRKLKIEEIDTDEASNLHRQSRINNSNIHVNLEANSAQRREEQIHLADHRLVKESNFSNLQQFTESSESNQNVESTSLMHSNKIKLQPNTNLVSHSLPSPNKKHRETDLQASNLVHPHEELKDDMTKSNVFVSPTETALSSQRTTEKKNASQTNSTSVVILAGGAQERQNETMRRAMQTQSSNRVPGLTKQKSSHYELAGRPSSKHLNLHYQENAQHINQEVNTINSQSLLMPPPCQLVRRGSSCVDRTNGMETEEIYIESGSNTSNRHTKAGTSALPAELVHEGRRDEVHGELLYLKTPEDALGSALRSEESSRKFVGEFIQKARHEISNETQIDTTISTIGYSNQDHSKTSPAQYGSDDVQANNCESRHPSRGAGTKGPTDEIWHEIDPSVQEMSVIEAPDHSATSGPIIARRSGRSLWSMIADIVLLRWGSQAEMPTSAAHSHEKSTANESVSSETWFSGHEHDEKDDEIIRRGRSSLQTAVTSDQLQPAQPFSITQTYSPSGDKETPPEADVLLQIKPGNSSAKTLSSGSVQDDFGWRENGQDVNNPPLVLQLGEPSLTQPKGGTISSMGKTTSVTVETDFSVSSQIEGVDGDGEKLIKVGGPEVKNLELKQRKLQRAKQVPKDRFDEWEEAYRLESEQRKIDEMFMREALMEANRAANNWEVPVGAVLVQHGKIIARGCNLVEELRDSTAHAEMICIREASNVLRSWRLAETTLYVTLEPCPMCAGAILQARVDTLVWGAPNKLLGADGSWVRLFPSGEAEAGNGSEVADKPAPPVHPFHPKMTIRRGVLVSECADTMQQFFQLRRKKKEKKPEPPSQPSCLPITPNPSKLLDKMHGMFHFMFCL